MDESEYRNQMMEELKRQAESQPDSHAFLDPSKSLSQRLEALTSSPRSLTGEDLVAAMDVVLDRQGDPALRALALKAIGREIGNQDESIDQLLALLQDKTQPGEVRMAALQVLQRLAFTSTLFMSKRAEYLAALRSIVEDSDTMIREAALEILAVEKDEYVQRRLNEGLDDPAKALVSPAKAIQLLGQDVHAELFPRLREIAQNPPSPEAREEAVRLLAGDPESKGLLVELMRNKGEDPQIRTLSAVALQALDPVEFSEQAKQLVIDSTEDDRLRLTGLNGLTYFTERQSLIGDWEFNQRLERMRNESASEQLRDAVDRYLNRAK